MAVDILPCDDFPICVFLPVPAAILRGGEVVFKVLEETGTVPGGSGGQCAGVPYGGTKVLEGPPEDADLLCPDVKASVKCLEYRTVWAGCGPAKGVDTFPPCLV